MTTPPSPRIRRATLADAGKLSSIARRLFAQTFGPANTAEDMHLYLASAFSPDKQADELRNPDRIAWLVEDDAGSAVGYATLLHHSMGDGIVATRPAEIERIYVDAALHGTGIAQRLMQTCVDEATSAGCDVIWLAVWERNPRAIAFYEKSGFAAVGEKTFLLGNDPQRDRVMARKL